MGGGHHHTLAPVHIKVAARELCQHLADIYVGFTKLGSDPVHCVAFLRHSESPFLAIRLSRIISLTVVQCCGGRAGSQKEKEIRGMV